MNIILLSGGSGTRLWPLSNSARSKQFLKLLPDGQGNLESMVQRVFRQLCGARLPTKHILAATSVTQQDFIRSQLGDQVEIVAEPSRRNTFPAILLSAAYLYFEKRCDPEETVLVMPVDTYTEPAYFNTLGRMAQAVDSGAAELVLMGIKPTHSSEKYGYMLPKPSETDGIRQIRSFVEKPPAAAAQEMIAQGALWNGGVFGFRLGYLIDIAQRTLAPTGFEDLRQRYDALENTSFDYGVVEKAHSVAAIPFDGLWKDLGTWNAFTEEMAENAVGPALLSEDTANTHVINELGIPLVALGVQNLVVAACPDGILIADKDKSDGLKAYVSNMLQRPMYEERRWGDYRVIDQTRHSDIDTLTKRLTLKPGGSISYQRHAMRDEIWVFTDGEGTLVLDGQRRSVGRGDIVQVKRGQLHTILATTELHAIEIQIGESLIEEDIERFDWQW